MQIKTFKIIAPYLFKARVTPLLVGQTGVGKSQLVKQLGKELGFDRVLDFKLGNLQDQADLLGLMEFIKNKQGQTRTVYARPDFWPADPSEKVLVFFDELNRANRQLVQPIMELALEFRHHDYYLPEGCRVIAAMNPATVDYQTNDISDSALMDRFAQFKITPTSEEWASYMRTKLPEKSHGLINFFAQNEKALRPEMADFNLEVRPSHRKVDILLSDVVTQDPPVDVLQEIAVSMLGAGPAVAFMEHFRTSEKPATASDILNDFDKHENNFKEYSKPKTRRSDLINIAVTSLIEHLNKDQEVKLTPEQGANLSRFLNIIPADSAWNFADKTIGVDSVRTLLENDDKFITRMVKLDKKLKAELNEAKDKATEKSDK